MSCQVANLMIISGSQSVVQLSRQHYCHHYMEFGEDDKVVEEKMRYNFCSVNDFTFILKLLYYSATNKREQKLVLSMSSIHQTKLTPCIAISDKRDDDSSRDFGSIGLMSCFVLCERFDEEEKKMIIIKYRDQANYYHCERQFW